MARIWLLGVVTVGLALAAQGASVSRSVSVSLNIPPLSVLSVPERGLSGQEFVVEFQAEELSKGLLLPLEVKSNVPWAVMARILSEDPVSLSAEVLGGPEVMVTTEERPILMGRPGKHELLLRFKLGPEAEGKAVRLVLRIQRYEVWEGGESQS
jgi:hypothetical protein